jgi:hypothetical protein
MPSIYVLRRWMKILWCVQFVVMKMEVAGHDDQIQQMVEAKKVEVA